MPAEISVYPIGFVRKEPNTASIVIDEKYRDALLGLEGFSHVIVCYWFDKNDTIQGRAMLRVHPRGDKKNPLTGVFATHSPRRPNLIGITTCRIVSIRDTTIIVDGIDAFDGSPVIDLKCYIPGSGVDGDVMVPDWV